MLWLLLKGEMTMSHRLWTYGVLFCVACSGAETGEASLTLAASPRRIAPGGTVKLTARATDAKGKDGIGEVKVSTVGVGSLSAGQSKNLEGGSADFDFTCPADDVGCTGNVTVTATWRVGAADVIGKTVVQVQAPTPDAGTMVGTDGGTTSKMDAGTVMTGDAGFTLVADKVRIFRGVGDIANLTATYSIGGARAGENILFSTDIGVLTQTDATAGVEKITIATDAAGQAKVKLAEIRVAGSGTVTAKHEASGAVVSLPVEVLSVNQIAHVGTTCAGVACNIMGIRSSGFNENAQVRFNVKTADGKPAAGIKVRFSVDNPPAGLTVSPDAVTNAAGDAVANVQSSISVGAISVTAVVIPVELQTTSPTIGIRGAKPSNQGFQLRCDKNNLDTYRSPDPTKPLAQTTGCTVQLNDRYNNPVGTGTVVRLLTEAGSVPASTNTQAYQPAGGGKEGEGRFEFNTNGRFPAVDVEPFPEISNQYPKPRSAEPSVLDGSKTRNPRDGLVTLIAFVRGEEHFSDNNNNGVRDADEPFIDQGEPFVDENDNNIWDSSEPYIDEAPTDGKWNPPNGVWDKDVTIWTVAHVLYTDASAPSNASIAPSTYNVAKGSSVVHSVFMPDLNLNRITSGSTFTVKKSGMKGSVTIEQSNTSLDGFGFGLSARELTNADGTGPCSMTTPVCRFRTLITDWSLGYVGAIRITGAAATDMTLPEANSVTTETVVRSLAAQKTIVGTVQ
jgi:hypothetical protein